MYQKEVLKLLERIDHFLTLGSIDKLGLKPVHVSFKYFSVKLLFEMIHQLWMGKPHCMTF